MSAYVLTDLHFSTIAYWIEGLNPNVNAQQLADKLKSINIDSVDFRYSQKTRKSKVKLTRDIANYSTSDVIRLIECWSYQSCENGGNLDFLMMDAFLFSHFEGDEIKLAAYSSDKWSI